MRTPPQHMAANPDPRERHGAVGIGRVDDLELETVGGEIFEGPLEIERLERAIGVFAALGRTSGASFPSRRATPASILSHPVPCCLPLPACWRIAQPLRQIPPAPRISRDV